MLAEIAAKEQRAIEKLKEAEVQANILLEQAKEESEKIIYDANEQVADILDQAQREGHDEGVKQGRIDGEVAVKKELSQIINQANAKAMKTLQDAKEQTAEYFIRAEDDIAAIVMRAIEKILPQHFLDVPQVVLPVVREAIKYVRDQKEIKVHVEPDSYDLVLMARGEFQSMLTDGTAVLEIISDDTLKPGDCVIETPNGGVDARLLTQIELMKNAIQSVLNK
ncbi:MAG: flagellar assembly protein FliH [Selenomonadaceae bacterium]|nr:flagellar assembly protein FliH [Selenomonadaceae bacterium]